MNEKGSGSDNGKNDTPQSISMTGLSLEVGFLIAIPIVFFGLGGRLLDRYLDTSPLFLIVAIFLSMAVSGILVWRKVKEFERKSEISQ